MYIYYNPNPQKRNVGDCAIRAVAKATDQTWLQAYMELYVVGMQLADLPNSDAVWTAYLKSKGFTKHIIPNSCPDCYTVGEFSEEYPVGVYVLGTGNHAVTVINGDIYDSFNSEMCIPTFYMRKDV